MRRIVALLSISLLLAVPAAGAAGSAQPPEVPDPIRGYAILPPGQSGVITSPHTTDQLSMYASLIDDDDVTEEELGLYFKEFQFSPQGAVEAELSPRPDVTIYKDSFGIHHIYGDTDEGAAFGAGYATAEDRLWHADVLRHAAEGRIAEILGPSATRFDVDTRTQGYSRKELRRIFEGLSPQARSLIGAYVDGINQRIGEIEAGAALRPIEYTVQGVPLQRWSPIDTVALIVFQVRQFGEQSGDEVRNAALLQGLRRRLGAKLGGDVFDDLTVRNDPNAYPSIPAAEGEWPSQDLGAVDPKSVALPDRAARLWRRMTGGSSTSGTAERLVDAVLPDTPSSNAIAVSAERSATGNPLEIGAPQVGYSAPQFFIEFALHSPSLDYRGAGLPGAAVVPPIGRSTDHAWSWTVAVSDSLDTRVERLCAKGGGKVRKGSTSYVYKGRCRKMTSRVEEIQIGSGDDADLRSVKIFRTVHGPVVGRGTVGGRPVAIVRELALWKREAETIEAVRMMAARDTDTVEEFSEAVDTMSIGQNVVYVDESNIAFFHAGDYPRRSRGVDTMLPVWGTGKWEWRGRLPFSAQPKIVNPAQGWIVNWNNKPAAGWDNGDGTTWGPTQRVRLLSDQMEALLAGDGKATLSDIVDVIRTAATQDARAVYLESTLLPLVSGVTGAEAEARDAVAAWIAGGAHRWDRDRNQLQDFGPAVATFDTWFLKLVHRIFDDELGNLYEFTPVPISDDASLSNGSAYFADFSNHVWNVLHDDSRAQLARDYCDDLTTEATETCGDQATAALSDAVAELTAARGPIVAAWTWPADYIEFDEAGAVMVPPIPWQNRGTWNHAVEVLGPR